MAHSDSTRPSSCLGVFAKHWTPGEVKTRLAATVGNDAAAKLHLAFLQETLRRLRNVAARCEVVFAPPDREMEFEQLARDMGDWRVRPQTGGDLGQRLQRYFDQRFAAGEESIVVVAADSPRLPRPYVEQAFTLLKAKSVVLGPSEDGGYYLIGAARGTPPVFDGITWSSDLVFTQTTSRLREQNVAWSELPNWYDVDDAQSLGRLREELAAADGAAESNALRDAIANLLPGHPAERTDT